jgi:hypothetical protein
MDAARLTDLPMVAPEAGTTTRTPASVRHATFGMSAARLSAAVDRGREIKKSEDGREDACNPGLERVMFCMYTPGEQDASEEAIKRLLPCSA